MSDFNLEEYLDQCRRMVEGHAGKVFPGRDRLPAQLGDSMRYSFFAGGKRFRPALMFGASLAVCGRFEPAVAFATAMEMIHTYSLIHDDLPAMDDDSLRRGMPTCHVKYGEAAAILAGDALLTDAFSVMTDPETVRSLGEKKVLRAVAVISRASGSGGMVAGQALDIISQGHVLDIATLEYLHSKKTGALIRASVEVGAILAGATSDEEADLVHYADRLGLAFQIADDILDVEGKTEVLGKPVGSDEGLLKATYPALMGLAESKRRLSDLIDGAVESLARFGELGEPLKSLAIFVANRDH